MAGLAGLPTTIVWVPKGVASPTATPGATADMAAAAPASAPVTLGSGAGATTAAAMAMGWPMAGWIGGSCVPRAAP
jgi:hypothetical protein